MSKRRLIVVMVALLLFGVVAVVFLTNHTGDESGMETVRFGMLPYADHTYAIIGVEKGWFKDVGIDLQYRTIKVEDAIPYLRTDTLDIVSLPPGTIFASRDTAPNIVSFVFGDLFQGYAIMARPECKAYSEYRADGASHEEAVKATVAQMRGKVFAYPTEAAIKPFIDLVLTQGGVGSNELTVLVLDDPLTVTAMRNGQADFQVGGVPSRLVLQREGFKPIISSIDLAKEAAPTPDSRELAGILQNGWACTKEYFDANRPVILRMASVNFRIMKFMKTNRKEAIRIHMAYLTRVTGQEFSAAEGEIIYSDLDPFVTFEEQHAWFHNPNDPLYYANVNGAILNSYIRQGMYKGEPPKVDDVVYADDIYFEMERLKTMTDRLFAAIEQSGNVAEREDVGVRYKKARAAYNAYNYFDAERIARQVAKMVDVEATE